MAALIILGQSVLSETPNAAFLPPDRPAQIIATAGATIIRAELIRFESAPPPVRSRATGEIQRIIVFE